VDFVVAVRSVVVSRAAAVAPFAVAAGDHTVEEAAADSTGEVVADSMAEAAVEVTVAAVAEATVGVGIAKSYRHQLRSSQTVV
jgi:hypothetical protein